MTSITHKKRYLPHELYTRIHAVKLYRSTCDPGFVLRRYHVSKASLMRWNKRYDGPPDSLADKSHRPLTPHPTAHTQQELTWIMSGRCTVSSRHKKAIHDIRALSFAYFSVLAFVKRPLPPNSLIPRSIMTHPQLSVRNGKWMLSMCLLLVTRQTRIDTSFNTALDEAARERFIYAYEEQSSYSTCDFIRRAIAHFGYLPKIIQTDNGAEFTHLAKTKRVHPMDALCLKLGIKHQRIRPGTPRHNGKVEHSHRNDRERFYNTLKFYSLDDLQIRMKRYLFRSNNIPTKVLGRLSPSQKRKQLLADKPMSKPPVFLPTLWLLSMVPLPDFLKFLVSHH